jgi:hypothetical protein
MSIRSLMLASAAALIVTSFGAHAAPAASLTAAGAQQGSAQQLAADNTEFGARKRHRAYRGNAAAGAAMMGMMIGTIGTMIAAQQRREAYDAAYNRAYAAQYPYGYVPPQPQVYHHPHVHHHRPHFHHGHHGFRHGHHGHRMAAPFIHKRHFHR